MAKDPAFLFYSNDFLSGTFTMDNEQVGKYIRLLCLQHQKGILSKKDMLKICKTYDEDIFCKFTQDNEGNYFNIRLKEEYDKRKAYSESRSKNRKSIKKKKVSKSYVPHMENENENKDIIKSVIEYLNTKTNKKFKYSSKKTIDLINARLNEGFVINDFEKVIDNKTKDWISNKEMNEYLRPETLFSNKFEGYLNITEIKEKTKEIEVIDWK